LVVEGIKKNIVGQEKAARTWECEVQGVECQEMLWREAGLPSRAL